MKRSLYLRLFVFSIAGALVLSFISLFCLVKFSDMAVADYRYGYLMYIARSVEKSAELRPVERVNVAHYPAPAAPKEDPLNFLKLAEFGQDSSQVPEAHDFKFNQMLGPNHHGPKPSLWLVNARGEIISSTSEKSLPLSWDDIRLPKKVHGIREMEIAFWKPKIYSTKLDTTPETYIISQNERSLFQGPFLWIQGIHAFATAALAVFIALSICFFYLRFKSARARNVISRLAAGDLKARFEVHRFDEFGNLILDFNRMADEIENLVNKVNQTESTRSNLLQDLGHDLRTPLTSLNTSFETLKQHHAALDQNDREELYAIIGADIRYFKDLLDKLTTIASIDNPRFKNTTEKINLAALLEVEVKNRQSSSPLTWNFTPSMDDSQVILGDSHLIKRLFRNAFDNASHYANSAVKINIVASDEKIEVTVSDDGPGVTPEQINAFGKRRERREVKDRNAHDFSLGLGSVIMKTIAQVHDGQVSIGNHSRGAQLTVSFKRP